MTKADPIQETAKHKLQGLVKSTTIAQEENAAQEMRDWFGDLPVLLDLLPSNVRNEFRIHVSLLRKTKHGEAKNG